MISLPVDEIAVFKGNLQDIPEEGYVNVSGEKVALVEIGGKKEWRIQGLNRHLNNAEAAEYLGMVTLYNNRFNRPDSELSTKDKQQKWALQEAIGSFK